MGFQRVEALWNPYFLRHSAKRNAISRGLCHPKHISQQDIVRTYQYRKRNHFLGRGGGRGAKPPKKTPPSRRRRAGKKFLKGLSLVPEVSRRVVPELVEGFDPPPSRKRLLENLALQSLWGLLWCCLRNL